MRSYRRLFGFAVTFATTLGWIFGFDGGDVAELLPDWWFRAVLIMLGLAMLFWDEQWFQNLLRTPFLAWSNWRRKQRNKLPDWELRQRAIALADRLFEWVEQVDAEDHLILEQHRKDSMAADWSPEVHERHTKELIQRNSRRQTEYARKFSGDLGFIMSEFARRGMLDSPLDHMIRRAVMAGGHAVREGAARILELAYSLSLIHI